MSGNGKIRKKPVQRELPLQQAIWRFLTFNKVFCWIDYQPLIPKYKMNMRHHSSAGVSDILGIYKGKPLAIEVKYGSGKTSVKQEDFIAKFKRAGGIAFVARSIDDVAEHLDLTIN